MCFNNIIPSSALVTGPAGALRTLRRGMDKEGRRRTVSGRMLWHWLLWRENKNCDRHTPMLPPPSCRRVNLALAYTELTEELGRVRELAEKQSGLLRHVSQEPGRSFPSGDSQCREDPQHKLAASLASYCLLWLFFDLTASSGEYPPILSALLLDTQTETLWFRLPTACTSYLVSSITLTFKHYLQTSVAAS